MYVLKDRNALRCTLGPASQNVPFPPSLQPQSLAFSRRPTSPKLFHTVDMHRTQSTAIITARWPEQDAVLALLAASTSINILNLLQKMLLRLAVAMPAFATVHTEHKLHKQLPCSEFCVLVIGWPDCTALCSKVGQPECRLKPAGLSILHLSGQLWQDAPAPGCGRTCSGGG